MGRAARLKKERSCTSCDNSLYATAVEFKAHALMCLRLKSLGLILPTLQTPTLQEVIEMRGGRRGGKGAG